MAPNTFPRHANNLLSATRHSTVHKPPLDPTTRPFLPLSLPCLDILAAWWQQRTTRRAHCAISFRLPTWHLLNRTCPVSLVACGFIPSYYSLPVPHRSLPIVSAPHSSGQSFCLPAFLLRTCSAFLSASANASAFCPAEHNAARRHRQCKFALQRTSQALTLLEMKQT